MSASPIYDQLAAEFDSRSIAEEAPIMADHRAADLDEDGTSEDDQLNESKPVNPKVIAAGLSAGAAAALVVILVWILSLFGVEVPSNVQDALAVLLPIVAGGVGGWWKSGPA